MVEGKKERVTWEQVEKFVKVAAKVFAKDVSTGKINSVYSLPRGGLVLGVMLSHRLNIPLITDKMKARKNKKCLAVDDISDRGRTLAPFYKHQTTTMYWHESTMTMPTFTMFEKKDRWVVFPWECE